LIGMPRYEWTPIEETLTFNFHLLADSEPWTSPTVLRSYVGSTAQYEYADSAANPRVIRYLMELPDGGVTLTEGRYWVAVKNPQLAWLRAEVADGEWPRRYDEAWNQTFTHGPPGLVWSLYGRIATAFSSSCTYVVNPKNGSRAVTVAWANASPGVTKIRVISGSAEEREQAPSASGNWSTNVKSGVPTYGLWGGASRKDASTVLVPAGTACTLQP
jgi:hypothetical protein